MCGVQDAKMENEFVNLRTNETGNFEIELLLGMRDWGGSDRTGAYIYVR